MTVANFRAVQAAVAKGRWRESPQANDWVGRAVAAALGLDPTEKGHRAKIIGLLKVWIEKGMFVEVKGKDAMATNARLLRSGNGPTTEFCRRSCAFHASRLDARVATRNACFPNRSCPPHFLAQGAERLESAEKLKCGIPRQAWPICEPAAP